MASRFTDRLLTIVVTATLTSAVWIVIGSTKVDQVSGRKATAPLGAVAPPNPLPATFAERAEGKAGKPASNSGSSLAIPVLGVGAEQLTDTFNQARDDGERAHEAIDIMAPVGAPVVAAGAGTVERLFASREGGNTIYIRSPDGRRLHYYAHLRDYAPGLAEGESVERGQRIGTVGATGNADPAAPHLHFAILRTTPGAEWWEPATALNPYKALRGN